MRVVVDTNVFVSAALSPEGSPAQVLDLVLSRRVTLLISRPIFLEYAEVLRRKEFSFEEKWIREFLHFVGAYAQKMPVSAAPRPLPDPDDEPFIACALEGKADDLITGNKRHFPDSLCHPVKPVSPSEFLQIIKSK